MGSKVNYIHAINFVNLLHTPRNQRNQKIKVESRKIGLRFFPMNFHGYISFILGQNAYHACYFRSYVNR